MMIFFFRLGAFFPSDTETDGPGSNGTSAEGGSKLNHSLHHSQRRFSIFLYLDIEFRLLDTCAGNRRFDFQWLGTFRDLNE